MNVKAAVRGGAESFVEKALLTGETRVDRPAVATAPATSGAAGSARVRFMQAEVVAVVVGCAFLALAYGPAARGLDHLPYLAVIAAAFLWGARGAILVACIPAASAAIVPLATDPSTADPIAAVSILTVAVVTGLLCERLRPTTTAAIPSGERPDSRG